MYSVSPKITGFHGTYPENATGIKEMNFNETKNHDVWLGDGAYFFVDGIGALPPEEYARMFAIDQCWDKKLSAYSKSKYCVLEAVIKINDNKYLNLTDSKGAKLFNEYRDNLITKISESGKVVVGEYKDTDVLSTLRETLGIEFVKSHVYIKFAIQRVKRFESKIPNVTVLVVNNPSKNIHKATIKELKEGDIK